MALITRAHVYAFPASEWDKVSAWLMNEGVRFERLWPHSKLIKELFDAMQEPTMQTAYAHLLGTLEQRSELVLIKGDDDARKFEARWG